MEDTLQEQKTIPITLSLVEVKCRSFEISDYGIKNKTPVSLEGYEFVFTMNFNILEATKQASINLLIIVFEKKEDNIKLELANAHVFALFQLINFDEVVKKDNSTGMSIIPNSLIELCNGVTIASARGILSVKCENTLYSNLILPLIDPKVLVPHK